MSRPCSKKYELRTQKAEVTAIHPCVVSFDNFHHGFSYQKKCDDYEVIKNYVGCTAVYANDVQSVATKNNTLIVNSLPFTAYQPNILDHLKLGIQQSREWGVPDDGEIGFSAIMSSQIAGYLPPGITGCSVAGPTGATGSTGATGVTTVVQCFGTCGPCGPVGPCGKKCDDRKRQDDDCGYTGNGGVNFLPSPYLPAGVTGPTGMTSNFVLPIEHIYNVNQDFRLGHSFFSVMDPDHHLIFGFAVTNEDVYVQYSRLPFDQFQCKPRPLEGWHHMIRVGKRNTFAPLCDFAKYDIIVNGRCNEVIWKINDVQVYKINRIGFPLNRNLRVVEYACNPNKLQRPERLRVAFGFGTMLDAFFFDDDGNRYNPLVTYFAPDSQGFIPNYQDPLSTAHDDSVSAPNQAGCCQPANFNSGSFEGTFDATTVTPATAINLVWGQGGIMDVKALLVYAQPEDRQFAVICEEKYDKKMIKALDRHKLNHICGLNLCDSVVVSRKEKCEGEEKKKKCDKKCEYPPGLSLLCEDTEEENNCSKQCKKC